MINKIQVNRVELYMQYVMDQQWIIQQKLMQISPHTAVGQGLDELLKALCLRPRSDYETDQVIRERILSALT